MKPIWVHKGKVGDILHLRIEAHDPGVHPSAVLLQHEGRFVELFLFEPQPVPEGQDSPRVFAEQYFKLHEQREAMHRAEQWMDERLANYEKLNPTYEQ